MAEPERDTAMMRSQLGRARGLGSAKEGVAHWWAQRVSAIALLPLSSWFLAGIVSRVGDDFERVRHWLASPLAFSLCSLFLVILAYHGALGLKVVIEDYVRVHALRLAAILAMQFVIAFLAMAGIVALLTIAFGQQGGG